MSSMTEIIANMNEIIDLLSKGYNLNNIYNKLHSEKKYSKSLIMFTKSIKSIGLRPLSIQDIANNAKRTVALKQKSESYDFTSILSNHESSQDNQGTELDDHEKEDVPPSNPVASSPKDEGVTKGKAKVPSKPKQQTGDHETVIGRVPQRPEISYKPNQDISDLVGK